VAFCTRVRHCDAEGNRPATDWPIPGPPFAPWYEHWLARQGTARTVVWGHWARHGLVVRDGTRGLDTGCVWGGQLTAWIAEEDRLVHVPARRAYSTKD
jgi:bis(5'-nucleosyl)-tetraphosphatase (symmetrical)